MEQFTERFELIYKKYCELAKANGLPTSKSALSRFLGVTLGNMQKWEKGQIPTASGLQAIHDKLGFSYAWLIAEQGEPFEETATGDIWALKARVAELENELAESDRINRKLTSRLLDGDSGRGTTGGSQAAVG